MMPFETPTWRCESFCGANAKFPFPCAGWSSTPGCGLSPESPRCARRQVLEDAVAARDDEQPWLDDSTEDNYL